MDVDDEAERLYLLGKDFFGKEKFAQVDPPNIFISRP